MLSWGKTFKILRKVVVFFLKLFWNPVYVSTGQRAKAALASEQSHLWLRPLLLFVDTHASSQKYITDIVCVLKDFVACNYIITVFILAFSFSSFTSAWPSYSSHKGGWHGEAMFHPPLLLFHCFFISVVTILAMPQRPLLLPVSAEDSDHTLPLHLCLFICCVSFHQFSGQVHEKRKLTESFAWVWALPLHSFLCTV